MKILVGIPLYKPDERFLRDSSDFILEASNSYDIETKRVHGKTLVEAQNEIAEYFMSKNFDALLFLEDDHWGHKVEMLDAMVKAEVPVAAIKYYSRHGGFASTLMKFRNMNEQNRTFIYGQVDKKSGSEYVDLCGFGMTLIRREVFEKLERPYFRLNYPEKPATDINFSRRLAKIGIQPLGIFDYCLNHREITQDNLLYQRRKKVEKGGYMTSFLKNRLIQKDLKRIGELNKDYIKEYY